MSKVIVTEKPNKWNPAIEGIPVMTPAEYFASEELQKQKGIKVINLCKSYQYQTVGYYVSLLAEARRHKVLPVVSTTQDFRIPSQIKQDSQDFEELIQYTFRNVKDSAKTEFNIYFGMTELPEFTKLGVMLFNLFQVPILKASFIRKEKWILQTLKPLNLNDLSEVEKERLNTALVFYLNGKRIINKNYNRKKYDLAILVNPDEAHPPSDAKAIQKFLKAAEKLGFNTEMINKNDYGKIMQFDALLFAKPHWLITIPIALPARHS